MLWLTFNLYIFVRLGVMYYEPKNFIFTLLDKI